MILQKVKKILATQLGIKESSIQESSRILEDLGADSLDVVELLMTLEDDFGIVVNDDDAVKLKTVKDIVKAIDSQKK